MRFKDKVLFATGGASGIAEATVRLFVEGGGRAVVADMNGEKAKAVAASLPGCVGVACDVSDEASVEAAVAEGVRAMGGLDCVFNAGGHADFGPLETWDYERFKKMLLVHIGGTFLVSKHTVPHLKQKKSGAIVNVASVAAFVAQPNNAPYGAAKAGIAGYTRQLALELAPSIRVNCVAPGRVASGMTIPLYTQRGGGDLTKGMEQAGQNNPQKRVGEAREVGDLVCYLLSDAATFITGQTIMVDGGETII